jgi:hypothetical protein
LKHLWTIRCRKLLYIISQEKNVFYGPENTVFTCGKEGWKNMLKAMDAFLFVKK